MLTPEQESFILNHAYVPEHTVGLMTGLSGGEPFLRPDFGAVCRQFIQQNGVKEIYTPTNGYFTDHMQEMSGREPPDKTKVRPLHFIKLGAHCVIGPEAEVRLPSHSQKGDWEALKRALKDREVKIESMREYYGAISTRTLDPKL